VVSLPLLDFVVGTCNDSSTPEELGQPNNVNRLPAIAADKSACYVPMASLAKSRERIVMS
jgi:hypothetical protein